MPNWKPLTYERAEDADSGAVIFRLEGALTDSTESYALLDHVRTDIEGGRKTVILNLAKVDAVTSSGIGIIAASHSSAATKGARLCVTSMTGRVKALFHLVHLHTLIPEFDSETGVFRNPSTKAQD